MEMIKQSTSHHVYVLGLLVVNVVLCFMVTYSTNQWGNNRIQIAAASPTSSLTPSPRTHSPSTSTTSHSSPSASTSFSQATISASSSSSLRPPSPSSAATHTTIPHTQPQSAFSDRSLIQCPRSCPSGSVNVLDLTWNRAGLSDRITVLTDIGQLARSVCARLSFSKPRDHLLARQNHGLRVDSRVRWEDLFVLRFKDNTSSIFYAPNQEPHTELVLHTQSAKDVLRDYEAALDAVRQGVSFRWILAVNYYRFRDRVKQSLNLFIEEGQKGLWGACASVIRSPSVIVQRVSDKLLRDLPAGFLSLHIRRGDSTAVCDTSIEALSHYLSCSMKACDPANQTTVVVFTDETNPGYLSQLSELIQPRFGHFVNGEDVTATALADAVTIGEIPQYAVSNYLQVMIAMTLWEVLPNNRILERRRTTCRPCDPVCGS